MIGMTRAVRYYYAYNRGTRFYLLYLLWCEFSHKYTHYEINEQLSSVLARLVRQGELKRVGRGEYIPTEKLLERAKKEKLLERAEKEKA